MTYTASDVPARIDVLINGEGYRFLETDDVKGISSFAPTFLQRTNVSDAYGDEDQDWWLTMRQKDWSLGEGQRNFTLDEQAVRRYWASNGIRIDREGRLSLLKSRYSVTLDGTPTTNICTYELGTVAFAGGTNAHTQDTSSASSLGAHGATSPTAVAYDRDNLYVSGFTGALRRWNGAAWADFSATPAGRLAFLNNTLYGLTGVGQGGSTTALYRYSTAGVATTIFTWQGADGTAVGTAGLLIPYGGDLVITMSATGEGWTTLWIYDGVAPAIVAKFPDGISINDATVLNGTLMLGCQEVGPYGINSAVYYYANGQTGRLWRSTGTASSAPTRVTTFNGCLVFTDASDNTVKQYDPETGAISTLFTNPVAFSDAVGGFGNQEFWFLTAGSSTTGRIYPHASTYETSGLLKTSLFDGSTVRTKRFKSVVVEFDAGSDGNGGTVDIAYRLEDPDGSYTSLQTGATSGTEYAIGQNGRSISIQVTINKGTSTSGPTVKNVYLRAAPLLDTFRKERYVLDLTGVDGEQHLQMRDGQTVHPKDGLAMATDLRTAIASTTPITIVDEFGSYSAYLVPEECEFRRIRSQEYVAVITARQV